MSESLGDGPGGMIPPDPNDQSPQHEPTGDHIGQDQPDLGHPLNVLGDRLTRSCRYVFENQGVSCMDLVYVIQGLLAQVCLWEDEEWFIEPDEDSDEDDQDEEDDLPF